MIVLHLAVNDENGSITDTCERIDVEIDRDKVMEIEGELSFLEIPDNIIQIGNVTLPYRQRSTWVGNVHWNTYQVLADDVIVLLNSLHDSAVLIEALHPLFDRWVSGAPFTIDDLYAAIA